MTILDLNVPRQLRSDVVDPIDRNPLQRAYDNYHEMERDRDAALRQVGDLIVENRSLAAEVKMLRDQVTRYDKDRTRLQAVASTFGGQARSLASIFNDIMALAIKNGIEATDKPNPAMEQAGAEAQDIIQRLEPGPAAPEPPATEVIPAAPVDLGAAMGMEPIQVPMNRM